MKETIYGFYQSEANRSLIHLQMCGSSFCDGSYRIDRPHSGCACLEYVESGIGTVHIDRTCFYPKEGDSYFLPSGTDQHYFSDAQSPWVKHFINLSGPLLEHLIDGYQLRYVHHFPDLSLQEELSLIHDAAKGEIDPTDKVLTLLHRMFYKMHLHHTSLAPSDSEAEAIRAFLDLHTRKHLRLADVCRRFSKSESQIIRIFKKQYGTTPYVYLLNQKIELAKQMLLGTNLSVRQIAAELCFADEYYFSNYFKRKTGLSPAQYRTGTKKGER